MDQTFDTFMKELRAEHGQEDSTVTGLCQKDRSGVSDFGRVSITT